MEEKVIGVMYLGGFLTTQFTGVTVHECDMFTHLKLKTEYAGQNYIYLFTVHVYDYKFGV